MHPSRWPTPPWMLLGVTKRGHGAEAYQKMSTKEKVDFKRKMAEMYELGADDGQPPPPSLTPIYLTSLTSTNCFIVLFLSILRLLIDLCVHQLQWPHAATNVSISQHLKMGLVLATEGGLHQTETYIPSRQCVEAYGGGGWASNYGKWTNKSAVGWGSNNLPNLQAIWFLKTCRNWWYCTIQASMYKQKAI